MAGEERPQSPTALPERSELLAETTLHALLWLVVGCSVGLLLATLLLQPRLGELLAPFTYGRLVPLHLDLVLYGWCALPLIALLFRFFLPPRGSLRSARLALWGWSAALGAGAASWLGGATTGKPFLDWSGPARWLFVLELAGLETVLLLGWWQRLRTARQRSAEALSAPARLAGWGLLTMLAAVPAVMLFATRRDVYPPVNPATGGPTGASLLGSTLVVVALFLACPLLLGVAPPRDAGGPGRGLFLLALHFAAYLALSHGDASHHELGQILAVASLLLWPPWLARYLSGFDWRPEARRWLLAFGAWTALLFASAVLMFLPGILDRLKFTHALVAHAHLAMAGMATSFLVLVLVSLAQDGPLARALSRPGPFWLWQAGSVAHVLALAALGWREGGDPALLLRAGPAVLLPLALRWGAGAAMLTAALLWLGESLKACSALALPASLPTREAAALEEVAA